MRFKSAYLHHQRLQLRLTGNSSKGLRPFSSDRNHLFKVAHAIIPVCNQQGPTGPWGVYGGSALGFTPALPCAPKPAQTRGDRALSRSRPRRGWTWNQRPPPRPRPQAAAAAAAAEAPEEVVSDRPHGAARAGAWGARAYISPARLGAPAGEGALSRRAPGAAAAASWPGSREEGAGRRRRGGWRRSTHRALLAPARPRRPARAAAPAAACGGEAGLRRLEEAAGRAGWAGLGGSGRGEVGGGSASPGRVPSAVVLGFFSGCSPCGAPAEVARAGAWASRELGGGRGSVSPGRLVAAGGGAPAGVWDRR